MSQFSQVQGATTKVYKYTSRRRDAEIAKIDHIPSGSVNFAV